MGLVEILGLSNLMLAVALLAGGALGERRARRQDTAMVRLRSENAGLAHMLNTTSAELDRERKKTPGPRPVFEVPPPLSLTPPEGDDPTSWEEDEHRTIIRNSHTRPIRVSRELLDQTRPPSSESGIKRLDKTGPRERKGGD